MKSDQFSVNLSAVFHCIALQLLKSMYRLVWCDSPISPNTVCPRGLDSIYIARVTIYINLVKNSWT